MFVGCVSVYVWDCVVCDVWFSVAVTVSVFVCVSVVCDGSVSVCVSVRIKFQVCEGHAEV